MRILLVDDDTGVIQALLATLKSLPGHEVRVATSGEKAVENAAALGGVDLLITDVVMEPMDGFTLRDRLAASYPGMRTILISGYDLSDYAEQTQNNQLLAKPVDPAVLRTAVERELAPQPAAVRATPVAVPRATAAQPGAAVPAARVSSGPAPHAAVAQPGAAQPAVAAVPQARAVASTAAAVAFPAAEESLQEGTDADVYTDELEPVSGVDSGPSGENLIGQTLGAYQIVSYLGEGRSGSAYAAVQTSINRPVGLKVLDPSRQDDEGVRSRFIADARAKAHVQHPSIISVYEAGEADGRIFYAREYVDGQSIAEMQATGRKVDEQTALKILRVVADGIAYLRVKNIAHSPLTPASIYLGIDGQPRLANLATQFSEEPQTLEEEIQTLGRIVLSVAPAAQQLSVGFRTLLGRMVQAQTSGLNNWGLVLQGVKALAPKVVPVEAAKISAQDRAAIEAVEVARKQQRRAFWWNIGSLTVLFTIVIVLVLRKFVFTNERNIQEMVHIPPGTYTLPSGKPVEVTKDFWIDKYEVTWAEYSRFLTYLDKNPTADQEIRHPRMPRYLEHRPQHWPIYYGQARVSGKARSIPIDLNCPVIEVTWWDAYAYANWLGRELPTEEEWEIAASGGKAQPYPWGDAFDPKNANTDSDHNLRDPGAKGKTDGYNFWNPVDEMRGDRSPFGVVGMAGNVAEWTATWSEDNRFPVVKGGSFATPPATIDQRIENRDPNTGYENIGFRTISRKPPNNASK